MKIKVKEIDSLFIKIRKDIVKYLTTIKDVIGVSAGGDRESEVDEVNKLVDDEARDAEIINWENQAFNLSNISIDSTKYPPKLLWPMQLLPERNRNYIDRDDYMLQIFQHIEQNSLYSDSDDNQTATLPQFLAITGEAYGLGKSELAKEFCYRSVESSYHFEFTGWIDAANDISLMLSLRNICGSIRNNDSSFLTECNIWNLSKNFMLDELSSWLQNLDRSWVLVIDNMNSENIASSIQYYPTLCKHKSVQGLVIITSQLRVDSIRSHVLGNAASVIHSPPQTGKSSPQVHMKEIKISELNCSDLTSNGSGILDGDIVKHMLYYGNMKYYKGDDKIRIATDNNQNGDDRNESKSDIPIRVFEPSIVGNESLLLQHISTLCRTLHGNPMAVFQALKGIHEVYQNGMRDSNASVEVENKGRKGWSLGLGLFAGKSQSTITISSANNNSYVTMTTRLREFLNWIDDFSGPCDNLFSHQPQTAGICKTFFTTQAIIAKKMGVKVPAFNRALEIMAFISPTNIDLSMIAAWFRPPNTPLCVSIQKKWRLPRASGESQGIPSLGMTPSRLQTYNLAEFEFLIESVQPTLTISDGLRFSWRVHRTYDRIRDVHEILQKTYSSDMNKVIFPPSELPYVSTEIDVEDIVSHRRADLATFFAALTKSECWGHLCAHPLMISLLGYDESNIDMNYVPGSVDADNDHDGGKDSLRNASSRSQSTVLGMNSGIYKLLEPLFLLNVGRICDIPSIPPLDCNEVVSVNEAMRKEEADPKLIFQPPKVYCCSISCGLQESARHWLRMEGRYETVLRDLMRFFFCIFKRSLSKYKKVGSSTHRTSGPNNDISSIRAKFACDHLISHVLALLTNSATRSTDCFELCEMAYYYSCKEGMLEESLVFATRGLEMTKHIPPNHSTAIIADATWHCHLADVCAKLNRKDEARSLYEHSLATFRTANGSDSSQTIAVIEKLASLLYEQNRYRQSIRLYEEVLSIRRKAVDTPVPTQIQSLLICAAITNLVQVLMADAPDTNSVNRCLELKLEELGIYKKIYGEHSVKAAKCINVIGEIELRANRTVRAKQCFEDSLDILIRCVGDDSIEIVNPMYNLAMELHRNKKYDQAKVLYLKVLDIDIKNNVQTSKSYSNTQQNFIAFQNIANVRDSLGMMYVELKKYDSAMEHLNEACKIYKLIYGVKNREVALSLKNMASAWYHMKDFESAKSLYTEAMDILKTLNSRADEEVLASILNALGEIYKESQDYERARQLFMECLHIRVNLFGETHLDTIAVMTNIVKNSYITENFEEAREFCTNVLKQQKKLINNTENEDIAYTCNQLGEICRCLGLTHEAKDLFRESLRIYRKVYPQNNSSLVALQMNNLASMLFSLGLYDECEPIYAESLDILIALNHGSKESVSIAASLQNNGELQRKLKNNNKALHFHEQSLAIRLKLLGANHVDVASSLHHVADLMFAKGNIISAVDSATMALGIRFKAYGLESDQVVESLQLMAKIFIHKGQKSDAEKMLRDALSARLILDSKKKNAKTSSIGGSTIETANIISALCSVLLDGDKNNPQAHVDEKISLLENCLRIRRGLLGEEHPDVASTLISLARLLYLKGKFYDCIEIYRITKAIHTKLEGENHPVTCKSIQYIANCLKRIGKFDEACDLYQQCLSNARAYHNNAAHVDIAIAMDNLAVIYQLLEDYDAAAVCNENALLTHISFHKSEFNKFVATTYFRIGHVFRMKSTFSKAKLNYMKALNIHRNVSGVNSPEVAEAMEGLISALNGTSNAEEASLMEIECKEVHKKAYSQENPFILKEILSLGQSLKARGKYLEATFHFQRALSIATAMYGEYNVDVASALESLALLKEAKGFSEDSVQLLNRAKSIRNVIGDSHYVQQVVEPSNRYKSNLHSPSALPMLLSEKSE